MKLKTILLQLDPAFKDIPSNLEKVSRTLEKLKDEQSLLGCPLVLLPEMIFTGYCFKDKPDIEDYCVDINDKNNLIIKWAMETCQKDSIYLQFGLARKETSQDGSNLFFNSLLLFDYTGSMLVCYDKTHLYYTDDTWACEGSGFKAVDLSLSKDCQVKVGFAICMDFNNYKFEAPWEAYEMATFYANQSVTLLLCCMAWLESPPSNPPESEQEMIIGRLNYWAARLKPIIEKSKIDPVYKCTIVICNRIGQEGDVTFGGTSCCLSVSNGKVELLECLGTQQETELKVTLDL